MKILLLISVILIIYSCNASQEQAKKIAQDSFLINELFEKDSLLYFINAPVTGKAVELDSMGRVVKEIYYVKGLKHGMEIHYEYFESDLPVVVLEGNWTKGKKSGIWKSHDGEGQMTIIKKY